MSERIANAIKERQSELIAWMMELTPPVEGSTAEDNRQFIAGFVHVLEQAARGNLEPRSQYLGSVIPAIKAGGMSAQIVMTGMVRVAMAVASFFEGDKEAIKWATDFCADYTDELTQAYS